jgi:hypothetical protein
MESAPIVSVNIMGGLGNQMFQVASAYCYAKQQNAKLQILPVKSPADDRRESMYWETVLFRFQPFLTDKLPNMNAWRDKQSTMYEPIPPVQNQGLYLIGYYQSSKYFGNHKDEIKQLMRPTETQIEKSKEKHEYLIKNKDRVVVIHARRTDYLKDGGKFHGPLEYEYYEQATTMICKKLQDPIFLLTSDDNMYWINGIQKIPALQTNEFHILEGENEIDSLTLLQQFHHYIIANSTFAWWFVWLAEAKTVIAPKRWFGPTGPQVNDDIYEPGWIKL